MDQIILLKQKGSAKEAAAASWKVLRTSLLIRVPQYLGAENYYGAWRKGIWQPHELCFILLTIPGALQGSEKKSAVPWYVYRGVAEILSSFPTFPSVKAKKPH